MRMSPTVGRGVSFSNMTVCRPAADHTMSEEYTEEVSGKRSELRSAPTGEVELAATAG